MRGFRLGRYYYFPAGVGVEAGRAGVVCYWSHQRLRLLPGCGPFPRLPVVHVLLVGVGGQLPRPLGPLRLLGFVEIQPLFGLIVHFGLRLPLIIWKKRKGEV